MHFDSYNNIFGNREFENNVLSDSATEYTPFNYDFNQDIVPHIINQFTEGKAEIKRNLENIKLFSHGSGIGILFKNFDFTLTNALFKLDNYNYSEYISTMIFVNCRMGKTLLDAPDFGLAFYDCVFEERFTIDIRNKEEYGGAPIEFSKCTFNGEINFENINIDASICINECLFNDHSIWQMRRFARDVVEKMECTLYTLRVKNCIFKGEVDFSKAYIPTRSVFDTLIFYKDINFSETKFYEQITFHNLCFAPLTSKTMKNGFKSFIDALNLGKYKKDAKYYEIHYGDIETRKVDKAEFDIAAESGWLNIKQAALFLGVKYSSLLDMRKDDKVLGQQRIPYVGEGKNKGAFVSTNSIHYMLDNPFYYGEMRTFRGFMPHVYNPIITKEL